VLDVCGGLKHQCQVGRVMTPQEVVNPSLCQECWDKACVERPELLHEALCAANGGLLGRAGCFVWLLLDDSTVC